MRILTYILLLLPVSLSAGPYIELGVGKNGLNQRWEGSDSMGCYFGLGYNHRWQDYEIDAAWRHSSQCTRGDGFDEREEDSLDSIGVYGRYYF